MVVKETDAVEGDPQRSRRGSFLRPQPQQIIFDVLLFERPWISPAMKLRQLPCRPQIRFASPLTQPGDHHLAVHPHIP